MYTHHSDVAVAVVAVGGDCGLYSSDDGGGAVDSGSPTVVDYSRPNSCSPLYLPFP